MSALTDATAEARADARRALHAKARSLAQAQGIGFTGALIKVWLDPGNAALAKLAREPKPKRKPRTTPEQLEKRIADLKAMVNDLSEDLKKRARRKS